ncbi:hypothetical protein AGIG_G20496 [Arapaima gigas]
MEMEQSSKCKPGFQSRPDWRHNPMARTSKHDVVTAVYQPVVEPPRPTTERLMSNGGSVTLRGALCRTPVKSCEVGNSPLLGSAPTPTSGSHSRSSSLSEARAAANLLSFGPPLGHFGYNRAGLRCPRVSFPAVYDTSDQTLLHRLSEEPLWGARGDR